MGKLIATENIINGFMLLDLVASTSIAEACIHACAMAKASGQYYCFSHNDIVVQVTPNDEPLDLLRDWEQVLVQCKKEAEAKKARNQALLVEHTYAFAEAVKAQDTLAEWCLALCNDWKRDAELYCREDLAAKLEALGYSPMTTLRYVNKETFKTPEDRARYIIGHTLRCLKEDPLNYCLYFNV